MFVKRICLAALLALGATWPATAGVLLPVPVAVIYPGEVIEASMIDERKVQVSQVGRRFVVSDKSALIGKVARRTLLPWRPVPTSAVEIPDLVSRSIPVQLVFQDGGLTIQARAMTLDAGSVGDIIRVRNMDSGRTVSAMVQADGTVRVGAP